MTFIQPNKNKSILNTIIVLLVVAIGSGIFGMVALYNATVNLDHNITAMKTEIDSVGAASTKLNNQIVATLSDGSVSGAAAKDGLVMDETPQYMTAAPSPSEPWLIASHF